MFHYRRGEQKKSMSFPVYFEILKNIVVLEQKNCIIKVSIQMYDYTIEMEDEKWQRRRKRRSFPQIPETK